MKTLTITHGDGSTQTMEVEDDFDESKFQSIPLDAIENSLLKLEIQKKEKYLQDTDWYVARKSETGTDIPQDVLTERASCREFISSNRELVQG